MTDHTHPHPADRHNIDPNHEHLHRAQLQVIQRYKDGVIPAVQAICGKIWKPEFPIKHLRTLPRCEVCFPPEPRRLGFVK